MNADVSPSARAVARGRETPAAADHGVADDDALGREIAAEVATWPPLSDDALRLIERTLFPGVRLIDTRAHGDKPREVRNAARAAS